MSKNTKARAIIKELALQAKERLKKSKYGTKEQNLSMKRSIDRRNQLQLYINEGCKKSEITIKIINDSVDEENFNNKVYALLQENADIINPLGKLIDEKIYNSISSENQEKYILELSAKYTKAREKYLQNYGM